MPRVLFLADQFSDATRTRHDRHPGGAELTDEAALAACPWPVTVRCFRDLAPGETASYDMLVVANSQSATPAQLAEIAETGRHIAFEHDLRVCRWRGNFPVSVDPWHRRSQRCWCPHPESRSFFARAAGVIFLTAFQERIYRQNPFFDCGPSRVLGSSLFNPELLERSRLGPVDGRGGTVVFASPHRIKGFAEALRYCRDRNVEPSTIRGLPPEAVIELFGRSQRFVYLPIGAEWAGRMVVEARLMGCEVVANDHVGVVGEPFWSAGRAEASDFIADGPARFWRLAEALLSEPRPALTASARPRALVQLMDAWLVAARAMPRWLMPLEAPTLPARTFAAW